mmetsp:Transcript_2701/g.8740  ORF Transcript_2701/g.8740 Transcript_2701/m.8740 type:complete len:428 (-) Transcript_2701:118-1401(-)
MEGDAFLVPRPVRLLHGRGRPTDGRAAGLRQEVWLPAPSQAAGRPADGARPLRLLPHPRPRLLADLARPRRRFLLHQHDVHRRVGARGQDAPLLPVRDQGGRHPLLLRGDAAAGPRRGPFRRLHGPGAARPRGHAHAARDWDGAAVGGADPHPHAPPRVRRAVPDGDRDLLADAVLHLLHADGDVHGLAHARAAALRRAHRHRLPARHGLLVRDAAARRKVRADRDGHHRPVVQLWRHLPLVPLDDRHLLLRHQERRRRVRPPRGAARALHRDGPPDLQPGRAAQPADRKDQRRLRKDQGVVAPLLQLPAGAHPHRVRDHRPGPLLHPRRPLAALAAHLHAAGRAARAGPDHRPARGAADGARGERAPRGGARGDRGGAGDAGGVDAAARGARPGGGGKLVGGGEASPGDGVLSSGFRGPWATDLQR